MKQKLSDRIRPGSEAAPWVCREIRQLETENTTLKNLLRDAMSDCNIDLYDRIVAVIGVKP